MGKKFFTLESVTEGHPDKMYDAISDAILDALIEKDSMSRVACETCATTGLVMVMGEITTKRSPKIRIMFIKKLTNIFFVVYFEHQSI